LGPPSEVEIDFVKDAEGILLCYGVAVSESRKRYCEDNRIKLMMGDVIYSLLDQVKAYLSSLLPPHQDLVIDGEAKVLQIFPFDRSGRKGSIAGCQVSSGMISYRSLAKIIRNGEDIYDGRIESLHHFKDAVKVVKRGSECGLCLGEADQEQGQNEDNKANVPILAGDIVQAYHWQSTPRKLGEKKRTK